MTVKLPRNVLLFCFIPSVYFQKLAALCIDNIPVEWKHRPVNDMTVTDLTKREEYFFTFVYCNYRFKK